MLREEELQRKLNVVKSPLYINMGLASKKFSCGASRSNETRKKMSLSKLGWNPSEQTRRRMSEAGKNRPKMTELTKLKLSIKSRNPSQETRRKLSEASKNPSAETRAKISRANTGKTCSAETRAKIALVNSKPTDETRRKKSIGVRAIAQKYIFVIENPDGNQSSWASLEDFQDAHGIYPTTMRRTFKSGVPIRYGKNAGWRLSAVEDRGGILPNSEFILRSVGRHK